MEELCLAWIFISSLPCIELLFLFFFFDVLVFQFKQFATVTVELGDGAQCMNVGPILGLGLIVCSFYFNVLRQGFYKMWYQSLSANPRRTLIILLKNN